MSQEDKKKDIILPIVENSDGTFGCLRNRDGVLSTGTLTMTNDPSSIPEGSELIEASMVEGAYHVTKSTMSGPAQVSTPAYQAGWNAVFGGKQVRGQA